MSPGGDVKLVRFAWLWGMLAVALCGIASPAVAEHYQLQDRTCVGGASSTGEAFALPVDTLDCSASRFGNRSRFVRTHVDVADLPHLLDEDLVWQTNPTSFDSMLVRFTYANGERRLVDVDPQMASRNWFARTRFSVPVPNAGSPLAMVDMVVERPRTSAVAREAVLATAEEADREHYVRSLIYALACGLLLAPFVFDFLFLRMLRSRFIVWHAGMTFGLLGYVFFNSGLVFFVFPEFSLEARFQFNTASLALAVACAVMFVLNILEEGLVPRGLRRVLVFLVLLMLLAKIAMLPDFEAWRMASHTLFLMTLVPLTLVLLVTIGFAFRRGSRAAVFLLVSLLPVIVGGVIQLLAALSLVPPSFPVGDFLFAAMILQVLGTSTAVGDRFMVLRVERDRANMRAIKMQRMAHSDALTGVANRRAFDGLEIIEEGQALLIADIDYFKAINDERGHLVGDAVIAETAARLRRSFSGEREASIFRLGGEEFAVVFDCQDALALEIAAERMRRTVESGERRRADDLPPVTISVGGALGHGRPLREVYADADGALYRAKQAGRNQIAVAGER